MVKYGHIRIVVKTESRADGSLNLHLAESTSATDVPTGQTEEEADIGPRRLQLCYQAPHCPIGDQLPQRKRQHDLVFQPDQEEKNYVLGRFIALDQVCRAYPMPDDNVTITSE